MVEIDEKQAFSIIQKSKETGVIRIGINEVTKNIERGQAKAVFYANDVNPSEIVAHLPGLCAEMSTVCASIGNRAELGSAVGIKAATAVAIIDAGSAKKEVDALAAELKEADKKEAKEETKEEAPEMKEEEAPEEEKKEEAAEAQ